MRWAALKKSRGLEFREKTPATPWQEFCLILIAVIIYEFLSVMFFLSSP